MSHIKVGDLVRDLMTGRLATVVEVFCENAWGSTRYKVEYRDGKRKDVYNVVLADLPTSPLVLGTKVVSKAAPYARKPGVVIRHFPNERTIDVFFGEGETTKFEAFEEQYVAVHNFEIWAIRHSGDVVKVAELEDISFEGAVNSVKKRVEGTYNPLLDGRPLFPSEQEALGSIRTEEDLVSAVHSCFGDLFQEYAKVGESICSVVLPRIAADLRRLRKLEDHCNQDAAYRYEVAPFLPKDLLPEYLK